MCVRMTRRAVPVENVIGGPTGGLLDRADLRISTEPAVWAASARGLIPGRTPRRYRTRESHRRRVSDNSRIGRRSGDAMVAVVEAGDRRDRHDAPRRRWVNVPGKRAIVVQGLMRARGVVVGEVGAKQAAEMTLVEDDHEIQAFPADGA